MEEVPREAKSSRSRKEASMAEGHEVSEGEFRRYKTNHVCIWSHGQGRDLDIP